MFPAPFASRYLQCLAEPIPCGSEPAREAASQDNTVTKA